MIEKRIVQYFAAFLIMEGLMIGVFGALDALLFYMFWEAMLIPMFIIIGVWGGPRRVYATIKFFLYTFLGSVFMLVALIYLYVKSGSYEIAAFQALPLGLREQLLIFLAFLLAFAVKVPMWPVHTWLPDAHVEAPTGGSVVLAAIMLKMGGYGFLRFSLPITPDASRELDWLMIALSLIAVVYIGFVALVQTDMKKLIAYSSIAHMGFVTLGAFIVYDIWQHTGALQGAGMGIDGAMVQMISHGLISGALFLCVGVLYDRVHSRDISAYGGVINTMPKFAGFAVLFALANAGLPGDFRVRGRVPGHHRELPRQFLVRIPGRDDHGARRCLHAVDGQARDLRTRGQRKRGRAPGHQFPRAHRAGHPGRRCAPPRRVAAATARKHAGHGAAPRGTDRRLEARSLKNG